VRAAVTTTQSMLAAAAALLLMLLPADAATVAMGTAEHARMAAGAGLGGVVGSCALDHAQRLLHHALLNRGLSAYVCARLAAAPPPPQPSGASMKTMGPSTIRLKLDDGASHVGGRRRSPAWRMREGPPVLQGSLRP
jgi:hypothetical protein